jgi:hypothetical protein
MEKWLKIELDRSQVDTTMDAKIKMLEKEVKRLSLLLDKSDKKIAQMQSSQLLTKESREQLLTSARNLVEALENYNVVEVYREL